MRIAYLSDSSIPSSSANSVHVMKMCAAFSAAGHDVTLYCYSTGHGVIDSFRYYGLEPSFELARIRQTRVPGVRRVVRTLDTFRSVPPSAPPDLIYGRDLYGLLAVSQRGVPLVFEAHTPPRNRLDKHLTALLLRRRTLARLVVISEALAREYAALFPDLPRQRIKVAHDSADLPPAQAPEVIPWQGRPGVLQLGYVGSLLPGKGSEMVVRLAHALPQYDFHIVGGDSNSVRRLRERATGSNIYLHGHVRHALVDAYLARFDVALFPMQRNVFLGDGTDIGRWTSPLKLFEYMAAGKPIVGSDLDVVKEVLTDDADALLVPAADTGAWVRAIHRLAADPGLRTRLARAARERLVRHHTWAARADAVLSGIVG